MSDIDFSNTGTLVTLAFGGAFVLMGLFLAYFGVKNVMIDLESRNWPTVEAVYIESEVVKHVRRDRDNQSHTYTSYTCDHTYQYNIDGETYTLIEPVSAKNQEHAMALSKEMKAGTKITLYYQPEEPSLARTELLDPARNTIWFLGAILMPLFGIGIAYLGLFHAGE